MNQTENNSELYFEALLKALSEKKAQKIMAYEVKDYPLILERVIICTANNVIHLRALSEAINDTYQQFKPRISELNRPAFSGSTQSAWIIGDADICLIHLLTEEMREYYNLDELFANYATVVHHETDH